MCESSQVDRLIIPHVHALDIVNRAKHIYLRQCPCRVQAQRCSPETWEVCLLFEGASADDLEWARPASKREALAILKTMAQREMIHNLFYRPHSRIITEICSCCTCCCRPLRRMKAEGDYQRQIRSGYLAVTDAARCTGCGLCEPQCFFEARKVHEGKLSLDEARCFGCGKCLGSCPEQAITLQLQAQRGIPIPTQVG